MRRKIDTYRVGRTVRVDSSSRLKHVHNAEVRRKCYTDCVCLSGSRHYPGDASAPAAARNFAHAMVVAALDPRGWRLADDMEVVVSELVTVALATSPSVIDVALDVHYNHLALVLTHDGLPGADGSDESAQVGDLRAALLAGLTDTIDVADSDAGQVATTAMLRCDPSYTVGLHCRQRPPADAG